MRLKVRGLDAMFNSTNRNFFTKRNEGIQITSRNFSSASAGRRNPSLFQQYSEALEKHPVVTKAITSAIIAGFGDFGCQMYQKWRISQRKHEHDISATVVRESAQTSIAIPPFEWSRCAKFMLLNGLMFAPAVHVWYGTLGRLFSGQSIAIASKRMAADQFLFAPVVTATFLSAFMVLEGEAAKIVGKLRQDYWTTLVSNWSLWMPAQMINFWLVPLPFQVLFANGVGLFWNFYMSSQCSRQVSDASSLPHQTLSDLESLTSHDGHIEPKLVKDRLIPNNKFDVDSLVVGQSQVKVTTRKSS